MFYQFAKAFEPDGKSVRAVKVLDYSGRCEKPFELPLRERLLWKSARYLDLHGEFPDGEDRFGRRRGRYGPGAFRHDDKDREEQFPPEQPSTVWLNGDESGESLLVQAELERVRLACGKCHWCANERKRRWERAATGWIEGSPLTVFGTLTFGDEYFSREWNAMLDAQIEEGAAREDWPGFNRLQWDSDFNAMRADRYDPGDPDHDVFMRERLMAERQKMFKRLRHALERDVRFEGVTLKAHLSVYEYGDLRGRLHMHFIAHFDVDQLPVGSAYSRLRKFLKENWHGHGIGFVDVQHATPDGGVDAAKYMLQYLLKYEEVHNQKRVVKSKSRLACSLGYRTKGTDLWFAARPSLIPGGSLRPADPIPLEEREGFPASSRADADREDLVLSEASQKLSFAEMPHEFRVLAEEIARANLAWRDGDLWPLWAAGLERPEDDWAEVPPAVIEFGGWLLSRSYRNPVLLEERSFDEPPWTLVQGGVVPAPPVSVEVLGKPTSQRALDARGLGPDTVIQPNGSYRVHPDDVLMQRRVRNPADGSLYDPQTGEIFDDD